MPHHTHEQSANPAALPGQVDGKEYKYERVDKAQVDESGQATLVDSREDRGKEDPGMNYVDARPPVAPGTPIGVVPSAVTGSAPLNPGQIPGPFVSTGSDTLNTSASEFTTGGRIEPVGVQKTIVTEKKVIHQDR
ncbi:hypothetical protein RvY_12774 [Ramazzottius varieornatus]|uniref:Uncharacterized protein n=1 Tax=Ramazzottius varieornatus TaxID=947166 RepID=A0A1D1VKN4_RAMVA|nr:hypothetical protein RvY_12774 [Ramazzottius varieornatus]